MVLLSAQGMDVSAIAKVAFTSEDRVGPPPGTPLPAWYRSVTLVMLAHAWLAVTRASLAASEATGTEAQPTTSANEIRRMFTALCGPARDEQHARTFTGMGRNFQDHDRFAVESQGRVLDRTTEHLATTDKGLIAMRRQMLANIETVSNGGKPLMTDPQTPNPCRDLVVRSSRVPAGENPHDVWRTLTVIPSGAACPSTTRPAALRSG